MKLLPVGTLLLLLVQCTSLRLVCFEARGARLAVGPTAAAQSAEASEECERTCLRHRDGAPAQPETPTPTCALIPSPECALLAPAVTAVMPRGPVLVGPSTSLGIESTTTDDYPPPLLPRQSPPPKA